MDKKIEATGLYLRFRVEGDYPGNGESSQKDNGDEMETYCRLFFRNDATIITLITAIVTTSLPHNRWASFSCSFAH